jgi:outer membrane protein
MVRNRWFRALAASFALLAAAVAPAQVKIAVINVQRAVLDTAEIKKAQTELEAKYKGRQEAVLKLQSEIQTIQNQLQTMAGKLTPQAEQELTAQGQKKQREYQRLSEDLQADVDRDRNDVLSRASQRMQEVVKKLAEERGYDIVVDFGDAVYFKPALDITKDAVAAYDKAYPVK